MAFLLLPRAEEMFTMKNRSSLFIAVLGPSILPRLLCCCSATSAASPRSLLPSRLPPGGLILKARRATPRITATCKSLFCPRRHRARDRHLDYTGKDQHTALDLGLLDPAGLRCWSGGNKSTLTVGLMDATPSCLPGAIPRALGMS